MIKSILKRIENIRNGLFPPIPDEKIDMIVMGESYDYSQNLTKDEMITPNYFEFMFNDESEEV